jgi:hypothetical protein
MTPLYLLIIVFTKLYPLTATGMALCVNLGPITTVYKFESRVYVPYVVTLNLHFRIVKQISEDALQHVRIALLFVYYVREYIAEWKTSLQIFLQMCNPFFPTHGLKTQSLAARRTKPLHGLFLPIQSLCNAAAGLTIRARRKN